MAIKDANDKMMISSYCLSKLEMVNWYLELLEVGSKKYIVPQSKAHLIILKNFMVCYKRKNRVCHQLCRWNYGTLYF